MRPHAYNGENPFAREGWWTNRNALGDVRRMPMPRTEGSVISVTNVDKLAGPMPYSVTLNRLIGYPPRNGVDGANADIRARIQFGSGAASREIICDWNPGTQLDFSGSSFVRVDAITYAPIPGVPYQSTVEQPDETVLDSEVTIGVSIGMTAGPHPRPRYTERLPSIDAAASSAIIVPPNWAHAVQPYGQVSSEGGSIYAAGLTLRWIDSSELPFAVVPANLWPEFWQPIPASGRLRIDNALETAANITLVWELAL